MASKYASAIDSFCFAKFDEILADDVKFIIEEVNSPCDTYDRAYLKSLFNFMYNCEFERDQKYLNYLSNHNLYAQIKNEINKNDKNKHEIIRMKKTNEEACLWLLHFTHNNVTSNRCEQSALKIRNQITLPKYYNRLLFIYDLQTDLLSYSNKSGRDLYSSFKKLFNDFENILAADPAIKLLDEDVNAKIKEITIIIMINIRYRLCMDKHPNLNNNFMKTLTACIKKYYTFTHRSKKFASMIEGFMNFEKISHEDFATMQKKLLHENRQKVCFHDLINVLFRNKERYDVNNIAIIHENFDKIFTMTKTKLGCMVLRNTIIILRQINNLYYSEKLLISRLIALSAGSIVDLACKEHLHVVKLYEKGMKDEECLVCLNENVPGLSFVLECRNCERNICYKCGIRIVLSGNKKCPTCRVSIPEVPVPLLFYFDMVRDFKHELPAVYDC